MRMSHADRCSIPVTWKAGDQVEVNGRRGTVLYVYTNGYTLIKLPGVPIKGGVFDNDSTFGNELIHRELIEA